MLLRLQVVVSLHKLLMQHVLAPLASTLPATSASTKLLPLTAQPLPAEEELVKLLLDAMVGAGLGWRRQLYLCR
jgi:hypothetical protein